MMRFAASYREKLYPARSSRVRGEEGSALVETAVSCVLLLALLFGVMEISLALYTYHFISEAAREATRYAIVRGSSLGTDCTAPGYATCIAQPNDIQAYVNGRGFPGIASMTVTSTWLTSSGGACGTADSCKVPGNQVQVKVSYKFPLSVPFVPASNINMTSTSQMVISQ